MATTYKDLIQIIITREAGIIGPEKTVEIAYKAGINVDNTGQVTNSHLTIDDLERLAEELYNAYGNVTLIGCKVAVMRAARAGNLELPPILK